MLADILDDHELRTGYRQEGMFNAALSFSGKAISGVGIILGGLIINLIEFPTNLPPAAVPAEIIFRLGLVVGVIVPLFHLIPISLTFRYKITRQVHAAIRTALAGRKAAAINQ
jgi:Na+/melibiose symporter-like transporter